MTTIDIYPDCPKPEWMSPGEWCYCLGEGSDVFTVDQVFDVSATLLTKSGHAHGMESFTKLYRDMNELNERRTHVKHGDQNE